MTPPKNPLAPSPTYLMYGPLYFHYEGSQFFALNIGSFENLGVLFYEHVGSLFQSYQFYLEIFSRVLFNNLNKKFLPFLLKNNDRKNVEEKYFKLSSGLVCNWVCYINEQADSKFFNEIFFLFKKMFIIRLLF